MEAAKRSDSPVGELELARPKTREEVAGATHSAVDVLRSAAGFNAGAVKTAAEMLLQPDEELPLAGLAFQLGFVGLASVRLGGRRGSCRDRC